MEKGFFKVRPPRYPSTFCFELVLRNLGVKIEVSGGKDFRDCRLRNTMIVGIKEPIGELLMRK